MRKRLYLKICFVITSVFRVNFEKYFCLLLFSLFKYFLIYDFIKMESPHASNTKIQEGCDISKSKINRTPQNQKLKVISGDEFSLYHLHNDSSPNIRAGQDVLEVGWGDSPEPLNIEQKIDPNKTPVTYKKKIEIKESPKSSIPCKRRNIRSTFNLPSKTMIDISKYVAEVQELSKNIMKEFNSPKINSEEVKTDQYIPETQIIDSTKISPDDNNHLDCKTSDSGNSTSSENNNSNFDSVLQTFINEEDDWLSQALSSQEVAKTPHKGGFIKSKSENELTLPPANNFNSKMTQNYRNINNNFRRTSSFDLTKSPSDSLFSNDSKTLNSTNQYSLQEIERKRLEAKYRKERREIERKKLEALKKLEMKKLRVIKI